MKRITKETIRKFRGILKLKSGMKPATEQLFEDRREDRAREQRKLGKHVPR